MSYQSVGYDQLCLKAAHNSYQRDETLVEQITWNNDKRYNGGCRAVEFDITRHSDESHGTSEDYFQVTHTKGGSGPTLASYLSQLLAWHDGDTGHDPIMVYLDIKSEEGDVPVFPDELDAYLRTWFRTDLIYAPNEILRGSSAPLLKVIQQKGWPLLGKLPGRFLFCLSGTEKWKKTYAKTDPTARLCFADFSGDSPIPGMLPEVDEHRAVANCHLYSDQYDWWRHVVARLRAQRLLVRGWVLNSDGLWDKAQGAGVNLLATDKVSNHEWAHVGTEPFALSPAPPL